MMLACKKKRNTKCADNFECPLDEWASLHNITRHQIRLLEIIRAKALHSNEIGMARIVPDKSCLSLIGVSMSVAFKVASIYSSTHISRQERVYSKCSSLTFIVCIEHYADIFDGNHDGESPNDEWDGSENILIARFAAKSRRVHIQRTCSNIPIDDSKRLISQPVCSKIEVGIEAMSELMRLKSRTMPESILWRPIFHQSVEIQLGPDSNALELPACCGSLFLPLQLPPRQTQVPDPSPLYLLPCSQELRPCAGTHGM